jgi:D-sedoheptulose 7-phosphate isomerase
MLLSERIAKAGREHGAGLESLLFQAELLTAFVGQITETFHQQGKLLLLGSGSLGAVANLVANQFLHRLSLERPPLPVLSLSQNITLATALGRDGQGQHFFARQLRAMATADDIVFAFADFHRDEALEEGLNAARQLGCITGALRPGHEEPFGPPLNFTFHLDAESVPRATEGALFFGHLLCELIEGELFGI